MFTEEEERLVKQTIYNALNTKDEYTIFTTADRLSDMAIFVSYCCPVGDVKSFDGKSICLVNGSVITVRENLVNSIMNKTKKSIKEIAESGEGVKETEGKPNWDLVDLRNLEGLVKGLEYGCKKYAKDNWKKVPNPIETYYAATIRHLAEWHSGNKIDKESHLNHLYHVMCNIYFLTYFEEHPEEIV